MANFFTKPLPPRVFFPLRNMIMNVSSSCLLGILARGASIACYRDSYRDTFNQSTDHLLGNHRYSILFRRYAVLLVFISFHLLTFARTHALATRAIATAVALAAGSSPWPPTDASSRR
eukprot:862361-Pleurochrysis_carterae.AAC.2